MDTFVTLLSYVGAALLGAIIWSVIFIIWVERVTPPPTRRKSIDDRMKYPDTEASDEPQPTSATDPK